MNRPSRSLIRDLKEVLRYHGVRYRFDKTRRHSFAYPNSGFVIIGTLGHTEETLISVVFHELAHVLLFVEGKYLAYHDLSKPLNWQTAREIVRVALKAEKLADRRGALEMKRFYPEIEYIPFYSTPTEVNSYKKQIITYHRKFYSRSI